MGTGNFDAISTANITGVRYMRLAADDSTGGYGAVAQNLGTAVASDTYTIKADAFGGNGVPNGLFAITARLLDAAPNAGPNVLATVHLTGLLQGEFRPDAIILTLTGYSGNLWLEFAADALPSAGSTTATRMGIDNVRLTTTVNNTAPTATCTGFEPPMAGGTPVTVKKNARALPLKAKLFDAAGVEMTGSSLVKPPVVQVLYDSGAGTAVDVTLDALPVGQGTDGNQFVYTSAKWQYNLKTTLYTAAGTYTVFMESGDDTEYVINPTCVAQFVIK